MTTILDSLKNHKDDTDETDETDETCDIIDDDIDNYFKTDKNEADKTVTPDNDNDISLLDIEDDIVLGIDLGTTNTCGSIWRNGNCEIIPDEYGNHTIPSVVAFTHKSVYIGQEARAQIELNPDNSYYEVKRLIGRKYSDETVMNDMEFLTYKLREDGNDGNILLESTLSSKKKIYSPEEISSFILLEMKRMAERYLNRQIKKVVITVPAYFTDAQRQATKDASEIASLECIRIINEPTAAAMAYGLQEKSRNTKEMNVLVYDLGGGTCDISLLNISDGVFEVLGSAGNTHLGGSDFDNRLIGYCINDFKKKYKIQNLPDLSSMQYQKLKKSCENAKKMLSVTSTATIAVKEFYNNYNLFINITRQQFENICKDLLIMCLKPIDDVLRSCNMLVDDIDEVILVGGCTRMPIIRDNIKLFFKGKEPNTNVNPDEVVAIGAGIQGYILSHEKDPFSENIVLLDIIPLSLGVETIGGVMNVLISRNSVIPIRKKKRYSTDSDNETSVIIKIYEGERKMTKDNFFVGEFELTEIDPAPRGVAQIDITFSVDVNGIINVTAEDIKKNNKKEIKIKGNKGRLSKEKIMELIEDAKKYEMMDKMDREKKQYYYEIDDLCSNIIDNTKNEEYKLKEKDVQLIHTDIEQIMNWLKEKSYDVRNKKEYMKIIEKIKQKYGTLILKQTNENDNVKSVNNETSKSTTVYGDDDENEEEHVYEKIENDELGLKDDNEDLKKELLHLRGILTELCYNVFDLISSDTLKIDKDHMTELREYVDDILLWVHVKQKITQIEYKQKIDELNKACNDIVDKYDSKPIFEFDSMIKTKKNELEHLCFTLSSLDSNMLALQKDDTKLLKSKIENILDWILDNETNKIEINENEYQEKIDDINDTCNKMYNSLLNINIESTGFIMEESITELVFDTQLGTSIAQLRRRQEEDNKD